MAEPQTETSIVVVTYNSMATLERCLSSVLETTSGQNELIVVDNGSVDGTPEFLREFASLEPRVQVVCNGENLGYSAAANIGVQSAQGEFIVLLNPDTTIGPGTLERMRMVFDMPEVGAVGPTSNNCSGLQYIEHHIPEQGEERFRLDQLHEYVAQNNSGQSVETRLIMGFCLMLSRKAIEDVGQFDEDLFLGSDDLDYCWRLRNNGYQLRVARDAYVEHAGQVSFDTLPTEERVRFLTQSNLAFAKKLEDHYGKGNVPTSTELFGIDIFDPDYDLWPDD